nr:hypothetical protein Iba_chr01aCG18750 [Ipomoea batatas]
MTANTPTTEIMRPWKFSGAIILNSWQVNSGCQGTWHSAQNDLLHEGQVEFPKASPVSLTNMVEQSRKARQFIPGQLTSSMFASTLAMICLLMHSEQNELEHPSCSIICHSPLSSKQISQDLLGKGSPWTDEDASLTVEAVERKANTDEDASLTVVSVKSETNKASSNCSSSASAASRSGT